MRMISICLLVLPLVAVAVEDNWEVPRTPNGRPDIQGVWANNAATPLERPDALTGRDKLSAQEIAELQARADTLFNGETDAAFGDEVFVAALESKDDHLSYDPETGNYNQFWIVERTFDERTSLVVDPPDGKIPALTEDGQRRLDAAVAYAEAHPADSYTDRINSDRCITFGVPFMQAGYNGYFHIVQNANHVVVIQEMAHEARIIPLDDSAGLDDNTRQWTGDSRGRWEDDVLVVETKNFSAKSNFRGSSDNLQLVERFERVSQEVLRWDITVNDSTHWTSPWTVSMLLSQSEEPIFEYACHEANYSMKGILRGHRLLEAEARGEVYEGGL
ncbi:MAG: hypothetical protein ABGY96_21885 [bacterium]|nr:hypothetical protein [Gammaproteobacteria bacterium]HIL98180.1 hypothetical protein [Pseudomonadales bacterium]